MHWYGKKMGSAYLLLTIGSVAQLCFPDIAWVLIPAIAVFLGFRKESY